MEFGIRLGVIHKPCGPGRGEGGFQIVHVSPQGGRGVNRMVHVDFFSGLEYLFSNNYLKNDNLHHIYPKNCEKIFF